jgi:hypothetical protein
VIGTTGWTEAMNSEFLAVRVKTKKQEKAGEQPLRNVGTVDFKPGLEPRGKGGKYDED